MGLVLKRGVWRSSLIHEGLGVEPVEVVWVTHEEATRASAYRGAPGAAGKRLQGRVKLVVCLSSIPTVASGAGLTYSTASPRSRLVNVRATTKLKRTYHRVR